MIRSVRGSLEAVGPGWAIVNVGGVGLQVFVPAPALAALGPVGSQVSLHTYLAVREGDLTLYGFPSTDALRLFELFLGVSGIGPRHALGLLSAMTPEALGHAIFTEDIRTLASAPGVGKKTAARIILEVRGKLEESWATPAPVAVGGDGDVLAALMGLGYTGAEARAAMAALPADGSLTTEERVLRALQNMARI